MVEPLFQDPRLSWGHILLRRCRYALLGLSAVAVPPIAFGPAWTWWQNHGVFSFAETNAQWVIYAAASVFVFGIVLGQKIDRLELTAATDPYTGLGNRRLFEHRLSEELVRARKRGTPLSLILIDIDHLKSINDRHGHLVGDAAIQMVAASVRGASRGTDIAARFGGDEMVVLTPGITAVQAANVARRIQTALYESAAAASAPLPPVTVSCGIADTRQTGSLRASDLFGKADRALYTAKAEGRNRIALADDRPNACSEAKKNTEQGDTHARRQPNPGSGRFLYPLRCRRRLRRVFRQTTRSFS